MQIRIVERTMKKAISKLMILCCLSFATAALAQDTPKDDNMKSDSTKSDSTKSDSMGKLMSVTGKIGDDGKSFVGDKDGKNWTIINPEAVKGHEGHHVTLKAHVNADKMEVHVMSLKMAKDKGMKSGDMK
jgi:pentapeptide MXKDX repeat protein